VIYTIHGWSFNKNIWKLAGLSEALHIELPGHGNSTYKEIDLLKLSEEIAKNIEPKSKLIGWSLGATVACIIAARKEIGELILISPTPRFLETSQPETVIKKFLRDLKRNFKETVLEFRKLCFKREHAPIDFPIPEEETAVKLLKSFCYFDLRPYLRLIKSKTKIIVGEADEITKISGAIETFKGISKSHLIVKPGGDHFPFRLSDLSL